jgi:hypothetical protein
MSINAAKRQKKLEKKKAKRKAVRKELVRRDSQGMTGRLQAAVTAPILHCCRTHDLWEQGMGNVLISRDLPSGNVAFAMFLVDVSCLGVKNAFCDVLSRANYQSQIYDSMHRLGPVTQIRPETARKLIEGAVEYAGRFSLSPHPDYRVASLIFGNISAADCRETFDYGRGGKPYFVAGPHDDMARCRDIMNTLEPACGPNGFHYLLPMSGVEEIDAFDEFEEADDDSE